MPSTYEPIATTTLGSTTATITFSSIPSTYTDLILVVDGINVNGNNYDTFIRFNNDTATNYSYTILQGTGSAAQSYRGSSQTAGYFGNTNNANRDNMIVHIENYANTTTYKTYLARGNNPDNIVTAVAGLWRKTPEAINRIDLTVEKTTGSWASNTMATLYGIKAA